mmetsp:Transcript_54530/g.86673  ORF Transcript_54530/g.86673 Transcript_54530/m.86673 type:complete len:89 (+) Transcript_54530:46-312(+)
MAFTSNQLSSHKRLSKFKTFLPSMIFKVFRVWQKRQTTLLPLTIVKQPVSHDRRGSDSENYKLSTPPCRGRLQSSTAGWQTTRGVHAA